MKIVSWWDDKRMDQMVVPNVLFRPCAIALWPLRILVDMLLVRPPVNIILNLTSRGSFIPMALHKYVCIEVVGGTIALSITHPRATIETLELVGSTQRALSDCVSRERHK